MIEIIFLKLDMSEKKCNLFVCLNSLIFLLYKITQIHSFIEKHFAKIRHHLTKAFQSTSLFDTKHAKNCSEATFKRWF